MKKILLTVIILLCLILAGTTVVNGIKIGKIEIFGVLTIKEENEKLDQKIQEATKLASTDYQKKLDELNEQVKKLEKEKENYQDLVFVSTESEVEAANQSYDYAIDFLWIRVENHAKSEGVKMKMELTRSNTGADKYYNLNFTATGSYIGIAEFITDIEDDSKLGFKIEDFKMTSILDEGSKSVQATFVCKDVKIDGISSINSIVTNTGTGTDTTTDDNANS